MGENRKRPETIDDVLVAFDEVLDWAKEKRSPIGYFPAVYRGVTASVKEQVDAGNFEDCDRIVRFDVAFANRYLDAFHGWRHGEQITGAWRKSFEAGTEPKLTKKLTILQHLLLGVNAHMNLDLGCAASAIAPGAQFRLLESDFLAINKILDTLVDHDRLAVDGLSPRLHALDRFGKLSDLFVRLDIHQRRHHSWDLGMRLAEIVDDSRDTEIAKVDAEVVRDSHRVIHPRWIAWWLFRYAKRGEVTDVGRVIDALVGVVTLPEPPVVDLTEAEVPIDLGEQPVP